MPDIEVGSDDRGNVQVKVTNLSTEEEEKIRSGAEKGGISWIFGPPPCDKGIVILIDCGDEKG